MARNKAAGILAGQGSLPYELPPIDPPDRTKVKVPLRPLWTENKAKLIERYLFYFVLVTKHGTYVDGFAGPQGSPENWAAKLVLETEPPWLRHFHLCDIERSQADQLRVLGEEHSHRDVHVYEGDFNRVVDQILQPEVIGEREATFCLLDQRTFECDWATVERIASYKGGRHKIEIFYFLASWWFNRALAADRGDRP